MPNSGWDGTPKIEVEGKRDGEGVLFKDTIDSATLANGDLKTKSTGPVLDAMDVGELKRLPVIISCQGGDYTDEIYPELRQAGWSGYWIDAASALRMQDDAVIILDPVNLSLIRDAVRDFAQEQLWPHAARWDKEHHFPKAAHRGLAALGAYGICVPESLGGANLDYLSLAVVLEEIAAGDGGTSTASVPAEASVPVARLRS